MGVDENKIFILEIGDVFELYKNRGKIAGKVPSGRVLIDGMGIGDVGNIVLRDRKNLSQDGIITIVTVIDKKNKFIISGPDVITRGFVYVRDSEELINELRNEALRIVGNCLEKNITQWSEMKNTIRKDVGSYIYSKIKRKPMILPVIVEV